MERQESRNGPSPSQDGPNGENANMMRILQGMMENQWQQRELLQQGLLAVPREQKLGNILDFRRLQPVVFLRIEKPLDAEQWLINTTNLQKIAQIFDENEVEVAKIQLRDVVRT